MKLRKKVLGPEFAKPIPPKKKYPSIELESRRQEVASQPQVELPVINKPNEVKSLAVIPLKITAVESISTDVCEATKPNEAPMRECRICGNGATYSEHGYRVSQKRNRFFFLQI